MIPVEAHCDTRGHVAHLDITEHLDPQTLIRVAFEVSTDGGSTWTDGGSFTKQGGLSLAKDGETPETHCVAIFWHEPTPRHRDQRGQWVGSDPAPHRLIRGTVKIEGQAVMTALRIEGH